MNFGNLIIDWPVSYMQAWSRKREIEGNNVVWDLSDSVPLNK